ncbi:cytochrome c biogenesis protein CcsA [Tamlana sp. s12]|uniref:cytochrome c biogenesis protein n=1 Tax=Tamlana sp. s12 TaxID=1630406 RepID=UPI0007FF52CB|nr:cytochrome c biogenesis protein CcsA [Tamlana sp. s12]OBQ56627.1 cytochrome C biogenesis protein [Tamlana sp. s12]QQY81731.1 cytochrome c biogenesis protein CcsA [Tamlana sp. s12]
MNKIYRLFASPILAVFLLLIFAVSMATATFVENDFGTATAWKMIYDSWWFELVMLGLGLCFMMNIYKYRLWRLEKWSILTFHLAFIIILLGAGITRYASYGGVMRIREGATSNMIISTNNYLHVHLSNGAKTKTLRKKINFSPLSNNDFEIKTDFQDLPITISYNEFIADAVPEIIDDAEDGKPLIQMVVSAGNGRETVYLEKGEIESIGEHQHKIGFEVDQADVINITEKDGLFKIRSPRSLSTFVMATETAGTIVKDSLHTISLRTLYRDGDASFVPLSYHPKAKIGLISVSEKPKDNDEQKDDALLVDVKIGDNSKVATLLYREGFLPTKHDIDFDDIQVTLSYGAESIITPFSIKLNDFQLERYPGSTSPSAYASEVSVIDGDEVMPYRIYMNHVLDYEGYRFFQASYDTDELGTVLAVNHDALGTNVTYLGYFLMMLGMFFTLFNKNSRFWVVNNKLKKLKTKSAALVLIGLCFTLGSYAQNKAPEINIQTIKQLEVDEQHAELFGRLMVQDLDGRIKPMNTLASEFLRKLTRKPYFKFTQNGQSIRLSANQAFLAMQAASNIWQYIPLIKVDVEKGGEVFKALEVSEDGLVSFVGLLDDKGKYRLGEVVEVANKKKPAERSEFDEEIIKVDERFNILYNVFAGNYLKVFPNSKDENNKWHSQTHDFLDFPEEDAQFAQKIIPSYFNDVNKKDWIAASEKLEYIKTFQDVLGKDIIPSRKRIEAELWYNELNLNFWLFQVFFTLGALLLFLAILKVFTKGKVIDYTWNLIIVLTLVSFIAFTGNIILRWYVAQHAPWSNGYEMLVFVSWVLLLCGLLTFRKSDFALPLATLFSGALLFVSYLDWLSPEITNLMPVLKSYWLKIHVATIVSSYAPLALSAVLGFMALLLMIFKTEKTQKEIDIRIKELTYINEISMTIGLFVLSVGTFLGGIWANESWGRYWAWDPKETWALISIIVYAVVLHLRLIPGVKSMYVLNTASVFAFGSIIMTSFGVNYYLSGLHSYAAGDPLPIPKFIYVLISLVILVAFVAFLRKQKFQKNKSKRF